MLTFSSIKLTDYTFIWTILYFRTHYGGYIQTTNFRENFQFLHQMILGNNSHNFERIFSMKYTIKFKCNKPVLYRKNVCLIKMSLDIRI